MVNKLAIRRVANAIAKAERTKRGLKGKIGFNMYRYITPTHEYRDLDDMVDGCGTVACIAGWTCLLDLTESQIDTVMNSNAEAYGSKTSAMFNAMASLLGVNVPAKA